MTPTMEQIREWMTDAGISHLSEPLERFAALAFAAGSRSGEDAPIDMVLYCPKCGKQHIDQPETQEQYSERLFESAWWECGGDKPEKWVNPPHKSHLCRRQDGGCGHVWRPSDHPTNGVESTESGKDADTVPAGEDARDAARWRWLRTQTDLRDRGYGPTGQWLEIAEYGIRWGEQIAHGKSEAEIIDAAIDAAMGGNDA